MCAMFIPVVLVLGIISSSSAGYAGSGAASGNFVSSNGQQQQFTGTSHYGDDGPNFSPPFPNPGFPQFVPFPQFDFNNFFNGYMTALKQQQQSFNNFQQQFQQAAHQYASGYGYPSTQGFSGGGSLPSGGTSGFQGAGAFASIGPGGVHQSAHLHPENAASPNINTRFGPETASNGVPGGTFGVFTSSSSGSSNIDGKETNWKEASTTVNNNGKVTTYTVRDP